LVTTLPATQTQDQGEDGTVPVHLSLRLQQRQTACGRYRVRRPAPDHQPCELLIFPPCLFVVHSLMVPQHLYLLM
jgi:hypothetical protein